MKKSRQIYVIGSLRNRKKVMKFSNGLRRMGHQVFDDWASAYEEADQILYAYYKQRGFTYAQMIDSPAARNIFDFDFRNLNASDVVILLAPFGKAACLEAGYSIGQGKKVFMLVDKTTKKRADIMFRFLSGIFMNEKELLEALKKI